MFLHDRIISSIAVFLHDRKQTTTRPTTATAATTSSKAATTGMAVRGKEGGPTRAKEAPTKERVEAGTTQARATAVAGTIKARVQVRGYVRSMRQAWPVGELLTDVLDSQYPLSRRQL